MAQLTRSHSSMSNLAEEFPTRIMECGLLPLTCAGVEVSNKLHVTCTVVKGAPPASPRAHVTTHETAANPEGSRTAFLFRVPHPSPSHPSPSNAVKTADRIALLLDISEFFQRNKYSIIEAEVSTTAHDNMASDIFLVQQADGRKIQKPRQFAEEIRDVILKSNRIHRSNSTTPGTSLSSSRAGSREPSTHGGNHFFTSRGESHFTGGGGDAPDVIKRADDNPGAQERNGTNANGALANGAPRQIDVKSDSQMNANGISEAEVTALDLRLAALEMVPSPPEVEKVERHGTGDAYRAKIEDEDAGIEPGVALPAARSPPSRDVRGSSGRGMTQIEEEKEATVEWQLRTKVGGSTHSSAGFKLIQDKLANATEITMEVPDRVGLIADVLECLNKNNVGVVHAHIYTTAEGLASNYLSVVDVATGEKITEEVLEEVHSALAARCFRDSKRVGTNKTRPTASNSAKRGLALVGTPSTLGTPGTPGTPTTPSPPKQDKKVWGIDIETEVKKRMARLHGGEVHGAEYMQMRSKAMESLARQMNNVNLAAVEPAVLSPADRSVVDGALAVLPAYSSIMFQSSKEEIISELREVRWAAGDVAFESEDFIPNLYIIVEGSLFRDSWHNQAGTQVPALVLSRGCLLGEVALQHAYQTAARITSQNGEMEPVVTRGFAINVETFKRIVRSRIHRTRQLCTNVLNIIETFRMVPANMKELLLNAMWTESKSYPPGSIISGGGKVPSFHIILEGEVRAGTDWRQVHLMAADFFGEDALLSAEARQRAGLPPTDEASTHSHVAVSHTVTLKVTRPLLERLWGADFDKYIRSRHDVTTASAAGASKNLIGGHQLGMPSGSMKASDSGSSLENWPASPSPSFKSTKTDADKARNGGDGFDLGGAGDLSIRGGNVSSSIKSQGAVHKSLAKKALMGSISMHAGMSGLGDSEAIARTAAEEESKKAKGASSTSLMASFKSFSKQMKKMMGVKSSKSKSLSNGVLNRRSSLEGFLPASPKHTIVEGESFKAAKEIWDKASDSDSDASTQSGQSGGAYLMNDGYDSLENSVRGGMIHKKIRPTGGLLQSASSKLADHQKSSAMDIHKAESKPRPSGLRQSHSVVDLGGFSDDAHPTSPRGPAVQTGTSPSHPSMSWAPKRSPALALSPDSASSNLDSTSSPSSSPSPSPSPGGLRAAMSAAALGMTEEEMMSSPAVRRSRSRRSSLIGVVEEDAGERMLRGFTFAKQLGVGLTGSVYKAWRKVDGSRRSSRMLIKTQGEEEGAAKYAAVAVKVMDKAKILEINETAHVVQESKIMKSVSKHPFIVSMLESFQTPSAMFIVMEYASGRDMFFMIHERGTLSLFQTRAYVTQVTLALDHVHSKGFIYRDLKPENLLIREDGYLRLTDFGFAKALKPGERAYTVCGTPDYLAPETLRQQGCNRAADFWAIGVLLFEMMTGYPPFHGQTHSDLYRRITAGRMRSFPRQFDEDAADLVKRLLKQSEGERIGVGAEGIQKIRRHPFFKGFSWTSVLEQTLDMIRPDVPPDADKGPEDVKTPVKVECLEQPCHLSLTEQELFKAF